MIQRTETEPAEQAQPSQLTLLAALKDLGWFSGIFATVVGAPSILAIIQAVFIDYNLIPLLQWIVDGWNQLLYFLSMAIEPGAIWIIQIINNLVDLNMDLHAPGGRYLRSQWCWSCLLFAKFGRRARTHVHFYFY